MKKSQDKAVPMNECGIQVIGYKNIYLHGNIKD